MSRFQNCPQSGTLRTTAQTDVPMRRIQLPAAMTALAAIVLPDWLPVCAPCARTGIFYIRKRRVRKNTCILDSARIIMMYRVVFNDMETFQL